VPIPSGSADQGTLPSIGLDDELSALRDEVVRLRCSSSPPGPTSAKASTARRSTPCSRRAVAFKGRLVQYAGRVLRPHPGKATAEGHNYHDVATGVLASSLTKRAPGYTSLGSPDPRRLVR
jgi:hypothetical protein